MKCMQISVYILNYSDLYDRSIQFNDNSKEKSSFATNEVDQTPLAARITHRNLQTLWKTQLLLCQRARTFSTLSFSQSQRQPTRHDLYSTQRYRERKASDRSLSRSLETDRRNQRNQPYIVPTQNIIRRGLTAWFDLILHLSVCMNPFYVWQIYYTIFLHQRVV